MFCVSHQLRFLGLRVGDKSKWSLDGTDFNIAGSRSPVQYINPDISPVRTATSVSTEIEILSTLVKRFKSDYTERGWTIQNHFIEQNIFTSTAHTFKIVRHEHKGLCVGRFPNKKLVK